MALTFAPISHNGARAADRAPRPTSRKTDQITRARPGLMRTPCACGGTCPHCSGETGAANLQPKLTVNEPGDAFEREANRVADQVMRMDDPNPAAPLAAPERDSTRRLQRRADDPLGAASAPPIVHEVLRSPGQPLDAPTRAFMEPRFGRDFGDVQVHVGDKADRSARAVRALAYTVGRDIVFAAGRYRTGTSEGRRLLAHELTHTMQQSGGKAASDIQSQPLQVARQDFDAGVPEDIRDAGEPLPGGVPGPQPAPTPSPESEVTQDPCGDCHQGWRPGVYDDHDRALTMLDNTIAKIASYDGSTPTDVKIALDKWFKASSSAFASWINLNLRFLRVMAPAADYQCQLSTCGLCDVPHRSAWAFPVLDIRVCDPIYFSMSDRARSSTLVHEWLHKYGWNFDLGYCRGDGCPGGTTRSLFNADPWAKLVLDLG